MVDVVRYEIRLPWDEPVRGPLSSATYHVRQEDDSPSTCLGVANIYLDFFKDLMTAGYLSSRFSGEMEWSAYNVADAPGTGAVASGGDTMGTGANSLPTEVAALIISKPDPAPNVNRSRHNARNYIGPLTAAAITTAGRLDGDFLDALIAGMTSIGGVLADLEFESVGGSVANGWRALTSARVTNEPATVRRRQSAATAFASIP